MFLRFKYYCFLPLVAWLLPVHAQVDDHFELNEIVVSATYQAQSVQQIARSIAIITAADIAQSTSANIVDLLAREANINIRSFTGGDKFGHVDIRGMGDTAVSNVVVMVDGVRLNAADLSGADFSSISLSQIKRIEIIRGASSVRYGNGAVGGVINIITDAQFSENRASVHAEAGSYATRDYRASAAQSFDVFALAADVAYYDTEGYRDNGDLQKQDGKFGAQFFLSDDVLLKMSVAAHRDEYGLPGPVSLGAFHGSAAQRQASNAPNDGGETDDLRYLLAAEMDFADHGFLQINASHRSRENPFVIGYSPLISYADQVWRIDETSSNLDILHEMTVGDHTLLLGLNTYLADYLRQENGTTVADQSKSGAGDIRDYSLFASTAWQVSSQFKVDAGYRENRFYVVRVENELHHICDTEMVLVEISPGVFVQVPVQTNCRNEWQVTTSSDNQWRNHAAELGIVYQLDDNASFYSSISSSFRNPNVDELAKADADLKPQTGRHMEAGVRVSVTKRIETSLNLFAMRIQDEILYGVDPVTAESVNRNADEITQRLGAELDAKYFIGTSWYVWATLGYTDARFADSNTAIPLVAKNTASAGVEWVPSSDITFSLSGHHAGERFDGNDEDNQSYAKLDAYSVVDCKLIFRWQALETFAGINNLFDEIYATSAYSESYYPMPQRHYYAGIKYVF